MVAGRIPGRIWSLILAAAAFSRAASYAVRPPDATPTTNLLEGALSYTAWAVILVVGATAVTVGTLFRGHWATFFGHLILLLSYVTYALSVALAALCYGEPWAGVMLMLVVTLLHAERVFAVGSGLGRH